MKRYQLLSTIPFQFLVILHVYGSKPKGRSGIFTLAAVAPVLQVSREFVTTVHSFLRWWRLVQKMQRCGPSHGKEPMHGMQSRTSLKCWTGDAFKQEEKGPVFVWFCFRLGRVCHNLVSMPCDGRWGKEHVMTAYSHAWHESESPWVFSWKLPISNLTRPSRLLFVSLQLFCRIFVDRWSEVRKDFVHHRPWQRMQRVQGSKGKLCQGRVKWVGIKSYVRIEVGREAW